MDPALVGSLSIVALLTLIFLGMPVAFCMGLLAIIGLWMLGGWPVMTSILGIIPWQKATMYEFTVVPMFVLMGTLVFYCGFGRDAYYACRQWVGHFPGGLAQATILGNTFFAASSGSSVAATATFVKVAVPEMRRYGYDTKLVTGSVAAAGPLAAMIPPSITLVVYGMVTEQSIRQLLIAGFLPGLLLALSFIVHIHWRTWRNPSLGGAMPRATWKTRILAIKHIWGVAVLFLIVMGGIYSGIITPTEAGAVGAAGAALVGFVTRRLRLHELWVSVTDAAKMMGVLMAILVGSFLYNTLLTYSRLPNMAVELLTGLSIPPAGILAGILILWLILGCIMPPLAVLFLTMPAVFPLTVAMDWNPIWFGILYVATTEIGCITPPFGLTLFAAKASLPDVSMDTIIRGSLPFLIPEMVVLVLLVIFPQIALFLPNLVK